MEVRYPVFIPRGRVWRGRVRLYTEDDLRVLCIFAEHAGIVATKTLDNNRISRVIGKMRQRNRNLAEKLAELGEAPPSGGDTEHRDAA